MPPEFSAQSKQRIERVLSRYPNKQAALLPVLHIAQELGLPVVEQIIPREMLYIAEELSDNHFSIAGGRAGMKVSWQVTGVRHDAYANANPLEVEKDKGKERGHYLHPELFGATPEQSVGWDQSRLPRVKSAANEASQSKP